MTKQALKQEFYNQLKLGKLTLQQKKYQISFYHLENAHILGQKHLYRHTVSHYWMLIWAINSKNNKETFGQLLRVLAAILFTLIWVPKGNTGGSDISPIKPIPIRKELQKYFTK